MSKSYFISDVHLGAAFCDRKALEQRFVTLLDRIREERADAVYLLGDIFDFWYEYRYVIPRGHTRALGALARLCDSGVKVYFFRGNHDVWVYDPVQCPASEMGFRSGLCLGRSFQKDEECSGQ